MTLCGPATEDLVCDCHVLDDDDIDATVVLAYLTAATETVNGALGSAYGSCPQWIRLCAHPSCGCPVWARTVSWTGTGMRQWCGPGCKGSRCECVQRDRAYLGAWSGWDVLEVQVDGVAASDWWVENGQWVATDGEFPTCASLAVQPGEAGFFGAYVQSHAAVPELVKLAVSQLACLLANACQGGCQCAGACKKAETNAARLAENIDPLLTMVKGSHTFAAPLRRFRAGGPVAVRFAPAGSSV